jgi:hypothetical protein
MKRVTIVLALLVLLGSCSGNIVAGEQSVSASGVVVDESTGDPVPDAFVAIDAAPCAFLAPPSFDKAAGVHVKSDGSFSLDRSGKVCHFRLRVWGDPNVPAVDRLYYQSSMDLPPGENGSLKVGLAPLSQLSVTVATQTPLDAGDSVRLLVRSYIASKTIQFDDTGSPPSAVVIKSLDSAEVDWTVTRGGQSVSYSETIATPSHETTFFVVMY